MVVVVVDDVVVVVDDVVVPLVSQMLIMIWLL